MSLIVDSADDVVVAEPRSGRWINDWRPEDPEFWQTTGRKVARRNLLWSVVTEHIGFSMWSLWSVIVLFLGPKYHVDAAGKFTLTAVPTVVGAALRLPYTFAVAKFGGRNWTIVSALALFIPTIYIAIILEPGVSYTTLLVGAALAGVGGGNFASSMANINSFYPSRLKGWALGVNAGGGNIGVPAVQLVALLVLATAGAAHPRVIVAIYLPIIAIAAIAAAFFMDNVTAARNPERAMRDATHDPHTWWISLLYIGTFGSFIGFSFAFGQVLQVQFHSQFATPVKAAQLTFLGPLLGSLSRPVGGWLADKFGGAKVTFWNFMGMAAGAALVTVASTHKSLPLFLTGFVVLFVLSGIGNGSTYKMIPAIFRARHAEGKVGDAARISAAVIGIAGAIGAFGGVLVNLAFRQSFLTYHNANSAYIAFVGFYVLCVVVTWAVYLRSASARRLGASV
jgi:NNP family nitrate/nitrite transporter-like MFS transporter